MMRPDYLLRSQMPRARGFAIMSAIFLLVVLGLLGAMIAALSSMQQVSQVRDLDGTRAYYAARAGLEWGAYRVLRDGICPNTTLPPLAGATSGFTVSVICVPAGPIDEGGNTVMVYAVHATATRGTVGELDYVERQMEAVMSTP